MAATVPGKNVISVEVTPWHLKGRSGTGAVFTRGGKPGRKGDTEENVSEDTVGKTWEVDLLLGRLKSISTRTTVK